ncbi:hypothetical protein OC842_007273 [Tilletia horrida]|uniref:C3H1-type domain-containing protein n=1 Tax=Tilletia horrida TaxID=155126 RepID=A0AAN6G4Q5_9BASI|nr:hypothetical protein OC842_007273 [Tilletia horrida]
MADNAAEAHRVDEDDLEARIARAASAAAATAAAAAVQEAMRAYQERAGNAAPAAPAAAAAAAAPDPVAAAAAAAAAAAEAHAAAVAKEKEKAKAAAAEKSRTISFLHDPRKEDEAIRPWPGSDLQVPRDVVTLARQGVQIPLIWLTAEGIMEASNRGRKLITFPLDKAGQLQLQLAHDKDLFLPRGAFSQAMQVLVALWRAVGPPAGNGEDSQASLIEELHTSVLARATDEHWPIWRRYTKRVLDTMWEERGENEGIGFDVGAIDEGRLRAAERACFCPPQQADNLTRIGDTMVAQLLRADATAMAAIGARMDELHRMAIFNQAPAHLRAGATTPTSPRPMRRILPPASPTARHSALAPPPAPAPPSLKRKERDEAPQPFRRALPADPFRAGGGNTTATGRADGAHTSRYSAFCTTCLRISSQHSFRNCDKAYSPDLQHGINGWHWPGRVPYCHKFNIGEPCVAGDKCTFGHYCSACGSDTCRATRHLLPTARV